jgi:hypothetical protein
MGLVIAIFAVGDVFLFDIFSFFENPPFWISIIVLALIGWLLVSVPIRNAGKADAPVPPGAVV